MKLHVIIYYSVQVDVVYVGTIHPKHYETVLKMFEKKKPVLCEKPLTMNPKDTAALISAAKESNLFLMEVGIRPLIKPLRVIISGVSLSGAVLLPECVN